MSNLPTKNTPKPILERLDNLDRAMENVYGALDTTVTQTRDHIGLIMQTLEAMMIVVKADLLKDFDAKVDVAMKQKKEERLNKKADNEKQQLEFLVTNNEIKAVDVISPNSVIVGRMFDPNGAVAGVGREQATFTGFAPEAQAELLGKGVGFVYESKSKHRYEVLEVYDPVPKSTQPAAAAPVTPV